MSERPCAAPDAAHSDGVAFAFDDLGLRGRWHSEALPTDAERAKTAKLAKLSALD